LYTTETLGVFGAGCVTADWFVKSGAVLRLMRSETAGF